MTPSSAEAAESLNILRGCTLASGSSACAEEMMALATKIEAFLIMKIPKRVNHTTINDKLN